jgi:Amidohydrolase family
LSVRALLLAGVVCAGCAPPADSPPNATLVIEDVTVVDVETGGLQAHRDIVIGAGRILAVDSHRTRPWPDSVTRVSGGGRYAIPGLWDMHVHALWSPEILPTFLPLFVTQGVTGVRDMGGSLELLARARDSARSGASYPMVIGPGPIVDGPEPVQPEISVAVDGPARARQVVDSLALGGADFIKVYTLLPREAFQALLEEARTRGLTVVGHVPAEVTPEEAARWGQRSIEHLRDELEPFCTRVTAGVCDSAIAEFRRNRVWQVPTLHVLRMKSILDDTTLARDTLLRYLVPSLRQEWLSTQSSRSRQGREYFEGKRRRFQDELWLVGYLSKAGVQIMPGTDAGVAFAFPGFSLHDELELLVEAGLTPLDALRAGTLAPARFLAATDSLGTIAPGRVANLVLLAGNPLERIGATRQIDAVVLRGRLLDRAHLDRLLDSVLRLAARASPSSGADSI